MVICLPLVLEETAADRRKFRSKDKDRLREQPVFV